MAPILSLPRDSIDVKPTNNPENKPQEQPNDNGGMSAASIAGLSFFAIIAFILLITLTGFLLRRRAERNKLPPEKRPVSYHPFRTSSAHSSLLANAAPSPEDDKSSMFSRDRGSSVSLYVDTHTEDERQKRLSTDTVPLIPLQVTPAEEVHDPMERRRMSSVGSGVSGMSRLSFNTVGSLDVSPVAEDDERRAGTRPRSTSATSTRYYEMHSAYAGPQIPKIVHTPSP